MLDRNVVFLRNFSLVAFTPLVPTKCFVELPIWRGQLFYLAARVKLLWEELLNLVSGVVQGFSVVAKFLDIFEIFYNFYLYIINLKRNDFIQSRYSCYFYSAFILDIRLKKCFKTSKRFHYGTNETKNLIL